MCVFSTDVGNQSKEYIAYRIYIYIYIYLFSLFWLRAFLKRNPDIKEEFDVLPLEKQSKMKMWWGETKDWDVCKDRKTHTDLYEQITQNSKVWLFFPEIIMKYDPTGEFRDWAKEKATLYVDSMQAMEIECMRTAKDKKSYTPQHMREHGTKKAFQYAWIDDTELDTTKESWSLDSICQSDKKAVPLKEPDTEEKIKRKLEQQKKIDERKVLFEQKKKTKELLDEMASLVVRCGTASEKLRMISQQSEMPLVLYQSMCSV